MYIVAKFSTQVPGTIICVLLYPGNNTQTPGTTAQLSTSQLFTTPSVYRYGILSYQCTAVDSTKFVLRVYTVLVLYRRPVLCAHTKFI